MRRERDSLKRAMLELMAQPDGMTPKQMQATLAPELSAQGISARIGKACRNGWCFAAPKSMPRRYFDSAERAAAWVDGPGGLNQRQSEEGRERRAAILALIWREGGASTPELMAAVGIQASACSSHLSVLRAAGEAFSGTVGNGQGMGKKVRHFGSEAERDAWVKSSRAMRTAKTAKTPTMRAIKTPAGNDAPVTIPGCKVGALAPGEYTTNAETVYEIDNKPRPTARWQTLTLAPDERFPSFAAEWQTLRGEAQAA